MLYAKKKQQKELLFYFIAVVVFLSVFIILGIEAKKNNLPENQTAVVQREVQKRQSLLKDCLSISKQYLDPETNLFDSFPASFYKKLEKDHVSFAIYRNDSLVFWTNFQTPINAIYKEEDFSLPCLHLKNGWYLSEKLIYKNLKVVALSLIKNTYNSNQELLPDAFIGIDLPATVKITIEHTPYQVYNAQNDYLFSLQNLENLNIPRKFGIPLGIIFYFFLLFSLSFLRSLSFVFFRNKSTLFQSVILTVFYLLFVYVFVFLEIPRILYKTESFSFYYFDSAGIISLGNLVILSFITLQYTYFIVFPEKNLIASLPLRKYKFSCAIYHGILGNVFVFLYLYVLQDFIRNTNAGRTFVDLLSFDLYTILLLLAICTTTTTAVILFWRSTGLMNAYVQRKNFFKVATISLIPFLLLFFYSPRFTLLGYFTIISFFISYYFFKKANNNGITIVELAALIIIFTIASTTQIMWSYDEKEKNAREILIQMLPEESDKTTEILFAQKFQEMLQDSTLKKMVLTKKSSIDIRYYIKQQYLTNFWNQYYFRISLLTPKEAEEENFDEKYPSKTSVPSLRYKNHNWEKLSYIGGPIAYKLPNNDTILLYLIFDQSRAFKNIALTDLLVHEKAYQNYKDLAPYSFAKYVNRKLTQNLGEYHYPPAITDQPLPIGSKSEYRYFSKNKYEHLMFVPKTGNICWVISHKNNSISEISQIYIFLFVLHTLSCIVFMIVNRVVFWEKRKSFKARIQTTLISLILISFLLAGILSIVYLNNINSEKNEEFLEEKLHFLKRELEQEYSKITAFTPDMIKQLQEEVEKYSKIYNMGIAVYGYKGELWAASSLELYEAGIVSQFISSNTIRFFQHQNSVCHDNGKIGRINFQTSHFALRNKNKDLLCYIHLPTFSRPTDTQKELVTFISAYLNMYVIIIIISLIVLVIVSNFITKPLKIIREQFSQLSLTKKNQRINWKSNDDLGKLVEEYNQMVDKIEENAYLLAKSERESGWQDIARQVAHEIKNPLTPMKLSVQQLIRVWKDKSPDFDERLQKTSHLLIEQVDLLARIASEFSDIAKINSQNKEKVDLLNCFEVAKNLAEVNTLDIIVEVNTTLKPFVYADRQQLIRAFVNLFKNSWEAANSNETLKISIEIGIKGNFFEIKITDNGKGISDDMKKNIFKPYHTTKDTGTGLGLTIVKGIVESSGGSIDFSSKEFVGTTFIILLPTYFNNDDKSSIT